MFNCSSFQFAKLLVLFINQSYIKTISSVFNNSSSTNKRYLIHPQKCHIIKTKRSKFCTFLSQKRILLSRVMTGNGRFCSSYEVSPSSFRYYSSSVEYLTGICCPSVIWNILLVLVHFFRFNILWSSPKNETLWIIRLVHIHWLS